MLTMLVGVLSVALIVTLLLLGRAYYLLHQLEGILADADDRVRALELQLRPQRTP